MTANPQYPKRLIEVDLPIKKISAHARREKSIRHGHISTLHIWWARRPLAACRAVICAALWPDPADASCPQAFRDAAATILADFAEQVRSDAQVAGLVKDHWSRWNRTNAATFGLTATADRRPPTASSPLRLPASVYADLRYALLDFIADFANWDASTVPAFLNTARALTQAAHESLGGRRIIKKLVVDPFAGGGSIPLEALRVGADAFASDLNPVAVLLNRVVLEYIPKYGQQLANDVQKWGQWIKEQAEQELAEFYPNDSNGATPIAYLWARTIICEGPNCGATVPLMRSFWLAKKQNRSVAMILVPDHISKSITVKIKENINSKEIGTGTVQRGAVTCPVCGFTTPIDHVREQLKQRKGGTNSAFLLAVVTKHDLEGTQYRVPTRTDYLALQATTERLRAVFESDIPKESTPTNQSHRSVGSPWLYGMREWGDLFTDRQKLVLLTLSKLVADPPSVSMPTEVQIILALCVSKLSGFLSSLCMWRITRTCVAQTFGRQALPQVWDFGEMNPFAGSAGDWSESVRYVSLLIQHLTSSIEGTGTAHQSNATLHPLSDDFADLFFTDPPYYDSVAYAELSDFFYIWLKRAVGRSIEETFFNKELTPKQEQAIVLHPGILREQADYEKKMLLSLAEGRRILNPRGVGTIVFAHKSTAGWEAQLQAMIDAGWVVTASWPIDTERSGRVNAYQTASLASSIHLVCRPREAEDGSLDTAIGDWRDVLQELPQRIHAWLPRLAQEGVVGADAIFACLGPALEIYSRYSRVEKASGEPVLLKEYLEQVWAAVSKEALSMVFEGADATGLEEDARLTAMWLWTLNTEAESEAKAEVEEEDEVEEEAGSGGKKAMGGFSLEYDAARKIAQGLGAYLEKLDHLVEIKGSTARLRAVSERARYLFGQDGLESASRPTRKRQQQMSLFETSADDGSPTAEVWGELSATSLGQTVLDRVHQSMLLFAAGRSEVLKHFLVDEGVGQNARFWQLANALSALYPPGTEEKRWVEGVLARKKGLGF